MTRIIEVCFFLDPLLFPFFLSFSLFFFFLCEKINSSMDDNSEKESENMIDRASVMRILREIARPRRKNEERIEKKEENGRVKRIK